MIRIEVAKELEMAEGREALYFCQEIQTHELLALFGQSGSGKTSVLRMLAGLMKPDEGRIEVDGEIWFDSKAGIWLAPERRDLGYVFQEYALFPHLSVEENIAYGMKERGRTDILEEMLAAIDLKNLRDAKPFRLSGGQAQRVALARALVRAPKLFLLDEAFAALDHAMRLRLQKLLAKWHREYKATTLLVSHDVGEVVRLADRVIMLSRGRQIAEGKPLEILGHKNMAGNEGIPGEVLRIQLKGEFAEVYVAIHGSVLKFHWLRSRLDEMESGDGILLKASDFETSCMEGEEGFASGITRDFIGIGDPRPQ